MSNTEFNYVLPTLAPSEFPDIPRSVGAQLSCSLKANGEIEIVGNSEGLLYLARHMVAMAMLNGVPGLHVHLDPETGNLDPGSTVVTIVNRDFKEWARNRDRSSY